eukprot:TRINITY_DN738_c0_g1_i3.p2 TRINITY_DN738_c0_g1~~TRINITY_DN738_c0_g1_i3.p2  ORF type:complete len:317 (+),score=24.11 TRINITY_DN738_c0_g1_i3:56-1006(+)
MQSKDLLGVSICDGRRNATAFSHFPRIMGLLSFADESLDKPLMRKGCSRVLTVTFSISPCLPDQKFVTKRGIPETLFDQENCTFYYDLVVVDAMLLRETRSLEEFLKVTSFVPNFSSVGGSFSIEFFIECRPKDMFLPPRKTGRVRKSIPRLKVQVMLLVKVKQTVLVFAGETIGTELKFRSRDIPSIEKARAEPTLTDNLRSVNFVVPETFVCDALLCICSSSMRRDLTVPCGETLLSTLLPPGDYHYFFEFDGHRVVDRTVRFITDSFGMSYNELTVNMLRQYHRTTRSSRAFDEVQTPTVRTSEEPCEILVCS